MQGRTPCCYYLLFVICLWLVACQRPASATPEVVEVPIIVTRIVPQETAQEITQEVAQTLVSTNVATPPCAVASPQNSVVVTIGAILPLSSPGALLAGFAMQAALNIAVNDLNEAGGIHGTPIRLVTYDSAGGAERAAQFAERLILLDCAVGIVGLYHNAEAMAVADVAHRYGIPVIVAAASADDITARGYPEVFRLAPAHSMLAQVPTEWLLTVGDYNGDGDLTVTLIADNATSSRDLVDHMLDNMLASGITAKLMRVDLPSNDFSSVIARLVAHERLPDAIIISIKGQPALLLQSQLLAAGIGPARSTLLVQTYAGLESRQFWDEVPQGNGTVLLRLGAWPATVSEQGQDFAIKYDQYMGRWPEAHAFASYDAITLMAHALREAPTWQGVDLVTTLERVDLAITSANINFAYTSHAQHDGQVAAYQWHQWLDSQMLYLQYAKPNQPAASATIIWPPHYRDPNLSTAVLSVAP